jgi:hypothetical protein
VDQKPLGPERAVSLAQPPQEQLLSRRQARAQEAKARAEKRKAERERRRQWADHQRQQIRGEQRMRALADRRPQQADDKDDREDEERPVIGERERLFETPRFRFFGNWD